MFAKRYSTLLVGMGLGLPLLLSAASSHARDLSLEEVVVTAQKREQNAMDVPVTVDTYSAKDIETTGALVIEDIQSYIPGFEASDGVTQPSLKIRGVDSSNISTGTDPVVATFFDEFYLPSAAVTVAFSDMARVEVLKGPQGTLFGRNAAAGVINMVPNQPNMDEAEGFLSAKIGNYGIRRYEGMVNLAVMDNMAVRINALTNARDEFVEDTSGSDPAPFLRDNTAARFAVKWDITDYFAAQLAYDYDRVDNGPRPAQGFGQYSNHQDARDYKLDSDTIEPGESRDMEAWSAKFWLDINDSLSAKFITSIREFATYNRQDEDGTGDVRVYIDTNNIEDSDIFYNELQFNYNNSFLNLVFGANYSEENTYQLTTLTYSMGALARFAPGSFGLPATPPDILIDPIVSVLVATNGSDYNTETLENTGEFSNFGIYADADFSITDWLNIIVGLRYSKDDKRFTWFTPVSDFFLAQAQGDNFIFFATDGTEEGEESWDAITGRLVANIQVTEDALVFANYSTGYKAGGFDSINISTKELPLDPELVDNYEIGAKGDFLNKRIRAQLAYFYTEIADRQEAIESQPPGSGTAVPFIVNTDEEIEGYEITLTFLISEQLRTTVIYTERDQSSQREAHYDAQGNFVDGLEVATVAPQDYTLTLDWAPEMPSGSLFVHLEYIFEENTDRDQEEYIPLFDTVPGYGDDRTLFNARVSWLNETGNYEIAAWGKNLLDSQRIKQPEGLGGDAIGTYHTKVEDPKTYGIDLKYIF